VVRAQPLLRAVTTTRWLRISLPVAFAVVAGRAQAVEVVTTIRVAVVAASAPLAVARAVTPRATVARTATAPRRAARM